MRLRVLKRIGFSAAAVFGVGAASLLAASAGASAPIGAFTTKGAYSFVSASGLHPPVLHTDARTVTKKLSAGDFLVANFPEVNVSGPMIGEGGPLILNNRLRPVWFHPVGTGVVAADLQQETYEGRPVLVWWQGLISTTGGTLKGEVVVDDQGYRQVATLKAHSPWVISLHDAVIDGSNIWVTVYRDVGKQNLSHEGGPKSGTVYDAGVQEYALKSGKLLHTWDALNPGHTPNVPLSDSYQPASVRNAPGGGWDAYHVNSVQPLSGGEILVSMRNTWASYLIDTKTNKIVWRLGGKHSTFKFGKGAAFAWQHDVKMLPDGRITLFDDECCRTLSNGKLAPPHGRSQGLILALDSTSHAASRVDSYTRSGPDPPYLGSMQVLPNGNALVGWGTEPWFSEFTKSGQRIFDAAFPGKDQNYRALYAAAWVGKPYYPPSGALREAGGKTTVYVSWNGATEVASWEVLAGSSSSKLKTVATSARLGFETAIAVKGSYKVFKVRALDAHHHPIGTSSAFPK